MNIKFMMEFTNSCSKLCEFSLHLSQLKRDLRPNLQSKINFFAEAHNFGLATADCEMQLSQAVNVRKDSPFPFFPELH